MGVEGVETVRGGSSTRVGRPGRKEPGTPEGVPRTTAITRHRGHKKSACDEDWALMRLSIPTGQGRVTDASATGAIYPCEGAIARFGAVGMYALCCRPHSGHQLPLDAAPSRFEDFHFPTCTTANCMFLLSRVPGRGTTRTGYGMKGQDIGLLLKLVCLQRHESSDRAMAAWPHDWKDWEDLDDDQLPAYPGQLHVEMRASAYTARALELQTGISKTQINLSLKHCIEIGLARTDRKLGVPRANTKALYEFIVYGLKYVLPARAGELTRGITTGFAAPVLHKTLTSAGEHVPVWPYARGNTMGMKVEPLFKTAADAARKDPEMYALLALVDAIRLGQPRERNLAAELLQDRLESL